MTLHEYPDCVIAITLEGNTYVVQIPPALEPVFGVSDRLDDFWEDCFASLRGLQPGGVYFCTIRTEPDLDIREEFRGPEHVTIFVEDIVPAVLTRGGE